MRQGKGRWHAPDVDDAAFQISPVTGSDTLAAFTAELIGQLPSWFGVPAANAEYVKSATSLPVSQIHM